jgi:hypothetical protein
MTHNDKRKRRSGGEAHLVYDLAHDEIIMEGWIRVSKKVEERRENREEKRTISQSDKSGSRRRDGEEVSFCGERMRGRGQIV